MPLMRVCNAAAALLMAVSAVQAGDTVVQVVGVTTHPSDTTARAGLPSVTGFAAGADRATVSFAGFTPDQRGAAFERTPMRLVSADAVTDGLPAGPVMPSGVPLQLAEAVSTTGAGTNDAGLVPMPPVSDPGPETYAMVLAGLGALGLIASRRRQQE